MKGKGEKVAGNLKQAGEKVKDAFEKQRLPPLALAAPREGREAQRVDQSLIASVDVPQPERKVSMDQEKFIDLLNEDLSSEYQSIVQYNLHIST